MVSKNYVLKYVPIIKEYANNMAVAAVPFYIWTIGYAYHNTATAINLVIEKTNDGTTWTTHTTIPVSAASPLTQLEVQNVKTVLDSMGFVTTLTYNTAVGTDTLNFYHPRALGYFSITTQTRWRAKLYFDGVEQVEPLYYITANQQVINPSATGVYKVSNPKPYLLLSLVARVAGTGMPSHAANNSNWATPSRIHDGFVSFLAAANSGNVAFLNDCVEIDEKAFLVGETVLTLGASFVSSFLTDYHGAIILEGYQNN